MPMVGLIVYSAALDAGETRDAAVSVPIDTGTKPALTAIAGPDEEPLGF